MHQLSSIGTYISLVSKIEFEIVLIYVCCIEKRSHLIESSWNQYCIYFTTVSRLHIVMKLPRKTIPHRRMATYNMRTPYRILQQLHTAYVLGCNGLGRPMLI
jgi:hypothetical protein